MVKAILEMGRRPNNKVVLLAERSANGQTPPPPPAFTECPSQSKTFF